jgi:hypothetical protein
MRQFFCHAQNHLLTLTWPLQIAPPRIICLELFIASLRGLYISFQSGAHAHFAALGKQAESTLSDRIIKRAAVLIITSKISDTKSRINTAFDKTRAAALSLQLTS